MNDHREVIVDLYGVARYKGNAVVKYLLDADVGPDLNTIWRQSHLTREDLAEFYKMIGYSLSGTEDIFCEENEHEELFPEAKKWYRKNAPEYYEETYGLPLTRE